MNILISNTFKKTCKIWQYQIHIVTTVLSSSCPLDVVLGSSSDPYSPILSHLAFSTWTWRGFCLYFYKWRVGLVVNLLMRVECPWSCVGLFPAKSGWDDSWPGGSCPGWESMCLYKWPQTTGINVQQEWLSQPTNYHPCVCQQHTQDMWLLISML